MDPELFFLSAREEAKLMYGSEGDFPDLPVFQESPDGPDQADPFQMFLMRAVGEVQPGNIHTRPAHGRQCFLVLTGRADCTDNFRFSHSLFPHIPASSSHYVP